MSLKLYLSPDVTSLISANSPFAVTFNGRTGCAQDWRIYIRNDEASKYYTDIQVLAVDTSGGDSIVDGTKTNWYWKLKEKDITPTLEEWNEISPGNTLSLSSTLGTSIGGDIVTFLPFWIRIAIPRVQPVQTIQTVFLKILATEFLI